MLRCGNSGHTTAVDSHSVFQELDSSVIDETFFPMR